MTNKQVQPADTTEILPGAEPQRGPMGSSAYFDRAGMLWIAACLALAVGAGHLIPQLDQLLRQPAQPSHQRLELSRSQVPAAPKAAPSNVAPTAVNAVNALSTVTSGSTVGGQPAGAAISAAGQAKVW